MALRDEVLAVFRARPKQTLSSFQVACTIYVDRICAAGSVRKAHFPHLKKVSSCIHDLQETHPSLKRRRVTHPQMVTGQTT